MAALSSLNFTFQPTRSIQAGAVRVGSPLGSVSISSGLTTPSIAVGTAAANAVTLGGDMALQQTVQLAASANTTIDLTTFTDALGRSGGSFARVKYIEFWLLGTADDSTYGTACSSVTIGAASSNAFTMNLGGTAPTKTLYNGDIDIYATRKAAGLTVDSTHKNLKITNDDASNAAALMVTILGGTT